jgi:hypothetical protein
MNKKYKKLILIALFIIIAIGGVYLYVMNAGGRNIETEKADFEVTTMAFSKEFTSDDAAATKKYLNKAISISGIITGINVNDNLVILDETTICQFLKVDNRIQKGAKITIKGRFTGFDDLMGELKLDQCVILK